MFRRRSVAPGQLWAHLRGHNQNSGTLVDTSNRRFERPRDAKWRLPPVQYFPRFETSRRALRSRAERLSTPTDGSYWLYLKTQSPIKPREPAPVKSPAFAFLFKWREWGSRFSESKKLPKV